MPIIKSNEISEIKSRPVFIVLFGEPGVSKTTISLTSNNPILIDADKGFDRAGLIKDTLQPKNWEDVLNSEKDIIAYDTIIADTAKSFLDDVIADFVIREDYKNKKGNGSLSLAGYGSLGETFKAWVSRMRNAGKDIIIIAHSKVEKDGDLMVNIPDVTGGSYALLLRLSDQVGFVHMQNKKRVIRFTPTDKNVGKDTAQLGTVEVPDISDPAFQNFMAGIIEQTKKKITDRARLISQASTVMTEFKQLLDGATEIQQFNALVTRVMGMNKGEQTIARKMLSDATAKAGLAYNKEKSSYEVKETSNA